MHRQRQDCSQVWHERLVELRSLLGRVRLSDKIVILADLNLDLVSLQAQDNDERRVPLDGFVREYGLGRASPQYPMWTNSRGAASRIDYTLFSEGLCNLIHSEVVRGSDALLGTDRCCSGASKVLAQDSVDRPFSYLCRHGTSFLRHCHHDCSNDYQ